MIKKVLAIAVSIQLIMPLSLMASVQIPAPTKQDVEVLLDKPQKSIKDYAVGGVVGVGVTAFTVYVAYTATRLTKLSAKNKELAKEIASLSSKLTDASAGIASAAKLSANQTKAIASTNKRITRVSAAGNKELSLLKKENAALTQKLAESDELIAKLIGGQDELVKIINQHSGLINKNTKGLATAFSALENHAEAINGNAAMTQELLEGASKGPRRPVGFGATEQLRLEKAAQKTPARATDAYANAIRMTSREVATGKSLTSIMSRSKYFLRKHSKQLGMAGVALLIIGSFLPRQTQAAQISQSRLMYSRALSQAKAANKDFYAITAIELAKHNKPLVAAIIAEESQKDASLYPMFKAQIESLSSFETISLASDIGKGLSDYGKADNKYNLIQSLKRVDYSQPLWQQ